MDVEFFNIFKATANYDSVVDGAKIVQTAMEAYGRVDIVVNNAGILRDKSFHKMSQSDWDLVQMVHVQGAKNVTQVNAFFSKDFSNLFFSGGLASDAEAKVWSGHQHLERRWAVRKLWTSELRCGKSRDGRLHKLFSFGGKEV